MASSLHCTYSSTGASLFCRSSQRRAHLRIQIKASGVSPSGGTRNLVTVSSVLENIDRSSRDCSTLPRPLSALQSSDAPDQRSQLRVAYQGVPGAYSEAAAGKAYPNCEAVPCDQFETAFEAVERWLVDRAILPIENSLGGSIHRNYDLLLRHKLHIVGEVQYAVRHCLLAVPGVKLESLKRVLSHSQALAQCEHTLSKLGVSREAVDDTAGAAQFVAIQHLQDTGAIASASAAEIYGLHILAQDIQDCSENVTIFLMLAREPIIPGVHKPFKDGEVDPLHRLEMNRIRHDFLELTSIVFSLEEGPGMLCKALGVFASRNINLTKIESRPWKQQPLLIPEECDSNSQKYFNYLFYVDFEASMAETRAQNALQNLDEFATFLRVLGSYPIDVNGLGN